MERARSRWCRLAAALGIAFGVEVLVFFVVVVTTNFLPPQWAEVIGEWPLQPASYLVTLLAKAEPSESRDAFRLFRKSGTISARDTLPSPAFGLRPGSSGQTANLLP